MRTERNSIQALISVGCFLLVQSVAVCDVVDYWRFEEGSGSNVVDQTTQASGTIMLTSSGNVNDHWSGNVPSATVPQTGQLDSFSLLLGGNSFVRATRVNPLNLGSSFTIEMFFDYTSLPDYHVFNPSELFSMPGLALGLSAFASNNLAVYRFTLGTSSTQFNSDIVNPTGWNYFALVDNNGVGTFYLNGLSIGSGSIPDEFGLGSNSVFQIANQGLEPGVYLDEIRLSDTALDPSQFLNAIPEPSAFLLVAFGVAGIFTFRRQPVCR